MSAFVSENLKIIYKQPPYTYKGGVKYYHPIRKGEKVVRKEFFLEKYTHINE